MNHSTPNGITPPTPRLDREEPEIASEDDIPSDDRGRAKADDCDEERPHKPERE